MAHQQSAVEPGCQVAIGIKQGDIADGNSESRNRQVAHQEPVTNQASGGDGGESRTPAGIQNQHRADHVADGDALEHAIDAPMLQLESRAEPMEEKADGEEYEPATHYV